MDTDSTIILTSLLWAVCIFGLTLSFLKGTTRLSLRKKELGSVRLPIFFRIFLPFAQSFSDLLQKPGFERLRTKTDGRLVQGGLDQAISPEEFLGLRLIYLFFFCFIGVLLLITGVRALVLLGMMFAVYGVAYPSLWLTGQIRRRHRVIQRNLPNVLDLLTLSVEAGRDFMTGLRDILQTRESDALNVELERVFREVQLGKARRQALRNMADRVQQADLTSVVETLVQADELGVSIGHILRILGDQMRQKRFQHAEKLANESPMKLLLPLFLFIFPSVIIVMLGPILTRALGSWM